ncbi:MAG: PQQ-like beta-propeller repeat protein [Candidatus Saccharimonas sp.]|nr:PQQ-like beta-propeller repeat protein [Planctomycetaceae bacterium]
MIRIERGCVPQEPMMPSHHNARVTLFFAAVTWLSGLLVDSHSFGGDWPNILGPQRNGIAVEEKLSDKWPTGGPRSVWEAKVGSGFAGVAAVDGIAVLFHRLGDDDTLSAYDAASGKPLWSKGFPTDFQPQIGEDDGPRAVPTIHKGRIYAFAGAGGLYCVDLKTGEPVWQRQTHKEFRAPAGYFGAGSAPLVEGKVVIVNVGGDKDGAGIVAFDLDSGKTVWKATSEQASYSSPLVAVVDGKRVVLCITRLNLVALDPATGNELARTPFGQRGPTVNGAMPVVVGNRVLLTASYGIGAELVNLGRDKLDVVWQDEVLSSQYTTPIIHEGAVFGIDGRQDGGPISLKCFDLETRKVHWTKSGLVYATLIAADGKLLVMQTDGTLRLAELNKSAYRELGTASLLRGTTRALPALANGRLYVRNEKTLKCVELGK